MRDSVESGVPMDVSMTRMSSGGTLADRMTEMLKQRIRQGAYPPGSRLPTELAMAEGFGVSRTVVREAVSRLRADGLVDVRQGRGTEVLAPRQATAFRIDLNRDDYVDVFVGECGLIDRFHAAGLKSPGVRPT